MIDADEFLKGRSLLQTVADGDCASEDDSGDYYVSREVQGKVSPQHEVGSETGEEASRQYSGASPEISAANALSLFHTAPSVDGDREDDGCLADAGEMQDPMRMSHFGGTDDSPVQDVHRRAGRWGGSRGTWKRRKSHAWEAVGKATHSGLSGQAGSCHVDLMDVDTCREAALRLLDASPKSTATLRGRLLDKGFDSEIVEKVIGRLTSVQLLDDQAYAHSMLRYCLARQLGGRGTFMELVRKGIDQALAQRMVDQAQNQGDFEKSAWELGRRVAHRTHGLDWQVQTRRFWSAGGRKGHNPETLSAVATELFSDRGHDDRTRD